MENYNQQNPIIGVHLNTRKLCIGVQKDFFTILVGDFNIKTHKQTEKTKTKIMRRNLDRQTTQQKRIEVVNSERGLRENLQKQRKTYIFYKLKK